MNFKQVVSALEELMPNIEPGFSPLELPPEVMEALETDTAWVDLNSWFRGNGVENPLSVIKKESGEVALSKPGLWLLEGEPVILFGFDKKGPVMIPFSAIEGVVVATAKKGLYAVTHKGTEFPIQFRLSFQDEDQELPTVLTADNIRDLARTLNVGGGGDDWIKLRDVIEWGAAMTTTVKGLETKSLSKNGKKFKVYLVHTPDRVLSVTAKIYQTIELIQSLHDLRSTEGDLSVEFVQDGDYEGHKVFKVRPAKTP